MLFWHRQRDLLSMMADAQGSSYLTQVSSFLREAQQGTACTLMSNALLHLQQLLWLQLSLAHKSNFCYGMYTKRYHEQL